jgi:acyl transferase domain-containing protein/enoyl-CoA hydratase/carnithine racemase/acyl carrier protein
MEHQLRQIYVDLSGGRLSRQEALERIKALKVRSGVLLATPVWQKRAIGTQDVVVAERHVVALQDAQYEHYALHALACFERVQTILRSQPQGQVLLQVVVSDELLAGLSALLKTATLENPRLAGQVIIVPGNMTSAELSHLLETEQRSPEPVIRYDNGLREVVQWQEIEEDPAEPPPAFHDDGVYLITGGLGAVGTLLAQEIARSTRGARIILTGRSERESLPHPEFVGYRQLDLADPRQVESVIGDIKRDLGRLDGILHCAGAIADNFIVKKGREEFTRVLGPKVSGTLNLDHASRDLELDFLVLFSSVAGAMGNVGQADYAAANAFMDSFAVHRNRRVAAGERHGRTRSINWPFWQAGGMEMDAATREAVQRATGLRPMQTSTAMRALYRSLALPHDQIAVGEGDLARMRRAWLAARAVPPPSQPAAPFVTMDAANLAAKTEEFLCRELSSVLKMPPDGIDPQAPLERYGIDSLLALRLTGQLEQTVGTLSKTLFFEYQTIAALAQYLVEAHAARLAALFETKSNDTAPSAQPQTGSFRPRRLSRRNDAPSRVPEFDPIAIVGLSGRYPEAVDLEAYWRNLRDGKDCITEVPKERWDWREYYSEDRTESGKHYSRWGGFIAGVDEFDPLFFNISPKEARLIDPQERLFLQHAWMAIEDAGYTRAGLQSARANELPGQVGVYVGLMFTEYQLIGAALSAQGRPMGIAGSAASIANRVSYALNLHGPSLTLDTMCSSSLTAIHFACLDLGLRRTSMAIAGGVNVSIHPNKYLVLSAGQFISSDGHCQSFGEGGDGYIPGEGIGVVVLKRVADAERDGDHIYGIIRGSSLNHGGKTNGYTVPNPQAQASAISRALAESNTNARYVSYIEAHGTGTKLGDPIEIAALTNAFRQYTRDRAFCLIGSAKSNIGHCESAAGIAGLTKVLLQMQHRQIVPSLHAAKLNPYIDFAGTPFVVNQALRPWERPLIDGRRWPRIAGISSFGAGGSNAHLVVEEHQALAAEPVASADVLIPLSARTAGQLQQKVTDLLAFVSTRRSSLDLVSMAYTLQVGREAMDERLAFVAGSVDELIDKLQAYHSGTETRVYRGQAKRSKDAGEWSGTGLAELADLWVRGLEVDWHRLYDRVPRRASLPTYPFARERYWIDVPATAVQAAVPAAVPHPLLQRNTSDLHQTSYTSTFKGDESLFRNGAFSSSAYLEMARTAVGVAARPPEKRFVELHDVRYGPPIVAGQPAQVSITLLPNGADGVDFDIYTQRGDEEIVHCQGSARWRDEAPAVAETSASVEMAAALTLSRRELDFAPVAAKKAPAISLVAPGAVSAVASSTTRPRVRLSDASASPGLSPVKLYDRGHGVFSIELSSAAGEQVRPALERVQQEPSLKALLLIGIEHVSSDFAAIASFPYPAVAVLRGDTGYGGFMAAALCDFMVCNEDARYGNAAVTDAEAALLRERFGAAQADDFLLEASRTGRQLREKGWTCPIVPGAQVDARAEALAIELANKPQDALRLLKQHLTRRLMELVDALPRLAANVSEPSGPVAVVRYGASGLRDATPDAAKAIVLVGDDVEVADDVVLQLHRFIVESPVPIIAASAGARGNAWLIGLLCDACIHSPTGVYSAADVAEGGVAVLTHRLGAAAGAEVVLSGADYRGRELQQRVATLTVDDDVVGTARRLAESWGWRPRAAFTGLSLRTDPSVGDAVTAPATPFRSGAVTLTAHPDGVAVVQMEDRDARNMFSDALIEGVTEAFAHIAQNPAFKVVVLTGYDSHFLSGGTKETLLAIQEGRTSFTDAQVFHLPLDCKLPVIAAMQGHGIGAGWAMGMFADIAILSEESRYVSPYMTYGFTPGAGATWILALKMGNDLGRESLFTARHYSGSELRQRGLRLPILPRAEVAPAAMALARRIARTPRDRLVALKRQLTQPMHDAAEETYRRELEMHEKTFVGQPEARVRIQAQFADETRPAPAPLPVTPAGDALSSIISTLKRLLASELQMSEKDIDDQAPFIDLGLDSVSGVSWIRKVNATYGTSIEATKVYSHPALAQLGVHVMEEAEKRGALPGPRAALEAVPNVESNPVEPMSAPQALSRRRSRAAAPGKARPASVPGPSRPIAIVGMAGQFPQASTLDDFWRNLAEGRSGIIQVPRERWDVDTWYQAGDPVPGKTNSQWLGCLEGYDRFDPLFFNISPTEAELMDPQQRLFLQAGWHAIEDAGYDARALSGSRTGVFVGCATGDYHQLSRGRQLTAQGFTGMATSILAARISYFLNLLGPCVAIDTACSSSLVAIAQACDSLLSGDTDMALAGGVYVMAGPEMHIRTAQAGMLSPHGRCFTFDQRADGFVPGEGVGVVVLKRLADAERDGDIVYGIVEGWGINQDGKTNGITAPNPESQARLMQEVYEKFGLDPANIQLVETHGTATKLGDPIEVEGLKTSFGKYTQKKGYCALGSVKSNVGHCLTAAGIAGVLKLLLALRHRQLPPTINFERFNEHIDLTDSPFYVNTRLQEWKLEGAPRRQAAISSFGFSGTNAHLVIGEYTPVAGVGRPPGGTVIVPLSARTAEQLEQKARDLLQFIRREPSVDVSDVAYTLQVGRQPMEERVGFVVSSLGELVEQLDAYLKGEPDRAYRSRVERGNLSIANQDYEVKAAIAAQYIAGGKLSRIAELWAHGLDFEWKRLHGDVTPRRVSLPLYPFANERYWIDSAAEAGAVKRDSVLHPLLHSNTSDLTEHRYSTVFTGDESFFDGGKTLPRMVALDMARAAIERSSPARPDAAVVELRDVVWGDPIVVAAPTEVHTSLTAIDDEEVAFEIYSADVVCCQGRAGWSEQPAEEAGTLMAAPVWANAGTDGTRASEYGEHHVILVGRPRLDVEQLRSLLPHSQCVSLEVDEHRNVAERYSDYAIAIFERLQGILQRKLADRVLVQLVIADEQEQAIYAGVSGLLRTAGLENQGLAGQLIVVPVMTIEELTQRLEEEKRRGRDPLIRYRDGARQVLRWRETAGDQETAPRAFRDEGVYLITGGLGGLGLLFAKEILGQTSRARVVLTGRSALTSEKNALLDGLAAHGDRASYRQVDLRDLHQVEQLIAAVTAEHGQLRGVLHCAGMMIPDRLIANKDSVEFARVLEPKVTGTFNLDQAGGDVELDFFVLFSSVSSVTGNSGTADYAAANGFLDGFAAHRNRLVAAGQRHGRTLSINWPVWKSGGMRIDEADEKRLMQATGMLPMQTANGLEAFYRSLASPHDQVLVVEGIRSRTAAYYLQPPLTPTLPAPSGRPLGAGARMSADEVQQRLKSILGTVLKINPSIIDVDQAFVELGLDSFLGATLVAAINREYRTEISHLTVFDHPTVRKLALLLARDATAEPPGEPARESQPPASGSCAIRKRKNGLGRMAKGHRPSSGERIAIIGLSGRYPQAANLQQYWQNLVQGRNSIVEVSPSRWDVQRYYDPTPSKKNKTISKWMGALDDADRFDPLFFRISPQEAEYIDPHHRLFLEEGYRAFEDAGYSIGTLSDTKCGVYLGVASSEYALLLARTGRSGGASVTSNHTAIAAARIAYYLNLKGPAMAVDTACSSSLVAIHLACQALVNGEIDMALAGGVALCLTPESFLAMAEAGMLSPTGQCQAFDDSADGIVVGEGVGAVVLKRLRDAQAANDTIYGVILGSGINQDGKTNGITAPSINSQVELERAIYDRYGIDPETITYVEAHGTGTPLGDPIELQALATAFREKTAKKAYCGLGSVKSNIGHTTSAAGVASVQKVLLSLQRRTLVPTLNVTKETSRFDFENSPFFLVRETQPWTTADGAPRRAAVSSFGFRGTNAHLVIEEYVTSPAAHRSDGPVIVPLSTRTPEQLRQKADDLLRFLRAAESPVDLVALAYTLQIGREPMEERVGIIVSTAEELADKLSAYLGGAGSIDGVLEGHAGPGEGMTLGSGAEKQEAIDKWIAHRTLAPLADLWVRGLNLDWNRLYGDAKPRRTSLPTYPFAKERCWIDEARVAEAADVPFPAEADIEAIEDVFNRLDDDAIAAADAVHALKMLL